MNNIFFKDIDIEKEELQVSRNYYSPFIRLNTYKVTKNNNINKLIATNTDDNISSIDLVDYINKIYMQTTKKINISGDYSVGYVSFDGNYLIIVENTTSINSLIHKRVFDVRKIKLPKTTLQQLDELQKYSNYSFKENLVSRYAPIINNIINNEIPSIIKDNNKNRNEFYYYFFNSKDDIKQVNNSRPNPYPVLFSAILLNSLLFSSPYGYASPIVSLIYGVETGYLSAEFALFLKKKQNNKEILNKGRDYRDQCSNLINGDLKTYEEVIQKVANKALDLYIYNNDFYVNASKDMLVLNCYNDKSLNETKLELISLICEYIQFHSIKRENQMLEELFNNKLKEIEEKIDLSNLKPYYQDEDTINFLSFYCEPDNNNYYSKLIPIDYNPKMTYEKMKLIQKEEEKEKIKVK